jgi:hypothetical protein
VNARAGRSLESSGGGVDVLVHAAGQGGDAGTVNLGGDTLHGFEISLGGDGETGFDDVHSEAFKLMGDDELFVGVHAAAGRLLAIAQSGVKDEDLFGWGDYVRFHLSTVGGDETLVKLLFISYA